MKTDYTKLDGAILARIGMSATPTGFKSLSLAGSVREESARIADESNAGKPELLHTPAWRIVDRRLQALRKAGRISYQRKPEGWSLAKLSTSQETRK